jgi:ATP-dependent protease ClpP protease subunit
MNTFKRAALAVLLASLMFLFVLSRKANSDELKTIVLTSENTISLNLPIIGRTAGNIQQSLMDSKASNIYLVLNSPGGNVSDGYKIIETAKGLNKSVHTVSIFSASMSFIISQFLDKRYIIETGVMMSHRAYAGGMEGQVPGNLVIRTLDLLSEFVDLDQKISERANMPRITYENLTRDELWMHGVHAVELKFADEMVRIRCDSSLNGPADPSNVSFMGISVSIVFHKCPLITEPLSVSIENSNVSEEARQVIYKLLYNKEQFVRDYGTTRVFNNFH